MTFVTSTGTEDITTTIYSGTQIEFSSELEGKNNHIIYTSHSQYAIKNKIAFAVGTGAEEGSSKNLILEMNGSNKINTVNILPLLNNYYDIGKEKNIWKLLISSMLYTDILQTKTINLYSGE